MCYHEAMPWRTIEERLKTLLTLKVSFPAGTVWLPLGHLTIGVWLTSIAQTDEELRELNIPRIQFLQNRWPIVTLLELEWDDAFSNRRAVLAMYVGQRAYILFSDWTEYQVIASIEPKNTPSLYRAVIGEILKNRSFVSTRPSRIKNFRPDLVPELVSLPQDVGRRENHIFSADSFRGLGPADRIDPGLKPNESWNGFVSEILVGWIWKWLNKPELGFWHEDLPGPISKEKTARLS